jgi:phosphoserine phosphatase
MERPIKIVIFDMDGVLVDIESSWSYVHNAFKVGKNDNLSRYLKGEIDFRELMRRDISLWGHVKLSAVERILGAIPIMKGAKETVFELRRAGCRTAIISAGISVLADRLKRILGIDYSLANRLVVDESGALTGEGEDEVPLLEKAKVIERFASEQRIDLDDFAAVGDSRYDIPVFEEVRLGIAFNSSGKEVKQKADVVVNGKDLRGILPHIIKSES